MNFHQEYFNSVTRCLMTFQYIEEMLKLVLIRFEALVYFRLKGYSSYDLEPIFSAIQNQSMGRLIDKLKIFSDDTELISELREIKKSRDHIAHQSLLRTETELNDEKLIRDKTLEYDLLNSRGTVLLEKMKNKWENLDIILNKISGTSKRPDDNISEQEAPL